MDALAELSPSLLHRGVSSVPFRCLVLAPLSASNVDNASSADEIGFRPTAISAATFDYVLGRLAPQLRISVESEYLCGAVANCAESIVGDYTIASLNDFLPSNLVDRFPFFHALVELLDKLKACLQHKSLSFPLLIQTSGNWDFGAFVGTLSSRAEIELAVVELEQELNDTLNSVIHDQDWQRTEAAWRGIDWLCNQASTFSSCSIEIADYSKQMLYEDLIGSASISESALYQAMYSESYGQYGGVPFGALLVDDYFTATGADVDLLKSITSLAQESQFALMTAAAPKLLGVTRLSDLATVGSVQDAHRGARFAKWRSFTESSEASYALLTLPRVRFRPAYGKGSDRVNSGESSRWFHEYIGDASDECLWGNSAYLFLANTLRSFATFGLCTAMTENNGGVVSMATSYDAMPLEYSFSESSEAALVACGLNPLGYRPLEKELVFRTANSVRWASVVIGNKRESVNSIASARLEYLLIVLRIIHCLRILFRESIGSAESPQMLGTLLNRWLSRFVLEMESPPDEMRNERPLKSARVNVTQPDGLDAADIRLSLVPHLKYLGYDVTMEADVGLQAGNA